MSNLALMQFVLQQLQQSHVSSALICHCWPSTTQNQQRFTHMSSDNGIYVRHFDISALDAAQQFAAKIRWHDRPLVGVFLDWNCAGSHALVNMSSNLQLFNANYQWLIYDHLGEWTNFQRHFETINLAVDTQLTYALPCHISYNASYYRLYDVYNNGRQFGGRLNVTKDREVDCDRKGCRLFQFISGLHKRNKHGNRQQLTDISIKVAVIIMTQPLNQSHEALHAFLRVETNTALEMVSRFTYRLLMVTAEMMQCNLQFIYTDSWGHSETEGGCIGALINRSVEYCAAHFIVGEKRLAYLRPLIETGAFHPNCIFRTPRNTGMQTGVFLAPFSMRVWHFFGCILLLAAVLLWSIFRIEQRLLPQNTWSCVPSLVGAVLLAFGTACFQGSQLIPRSVGGRMAFFALSVICFVVYNYYTSAVVSSLLGAPIKSDIKSLGQLADSALDVGVYNTPYNSLFFNVSTLPEVRRFVRRKIDPHPERVWKTMEQGILRVRDQPGFVFLFEGITGYRVVQQHYKPDEICDLNQFPFRSVRTLYTHIHRNSSYKEIVKLSQMRATETGVFHRHRIYWEGPRLHCFANNILVDVGMEFSAPLFIILVFSYMFSLFILVLEIGCGKLRIRPLVTKRSTVSLIE